MQHKKGAKDTTVVQMKKECPRISIAQHELTKAFVVSLA